MSISRSDLLSLLAYMILLALLGFVYGWPVMRPLNARILFVLVASLAAVGLWQIKRISVVAAVFAVIAVVGLAIYTYNITSWRYSFWGDEYAYFNVASQFLDTFVQNQVNILNSLGIYQANPVFATFVQAVLMQVYGKDIYGWRLGSALMVFLAAPPIFWLARRLKGAGAGLLAVVVFVSSHYLIALAHISYVQEELLPVFTAMLAFAVMGLEQYSALAIYLSGVAGAFSFFTFILGFPLIPTPFLLLAIWLLYPTRQLAFRHRLATAFQLGVICLIGVWAVAFPRVVNTTWISDAGFETVFQSQVTGLSKPVTQQILPNVFYTLGASLYFELNTHYTSGAHLDPISSALFIAGIAGLIAVMTRRRLAIWLLISFLAAAFVIGGLVPYPYPPHTRAYLMEVYYALFAAIGAAYLWETMRDLGLRLSPVLPRIALAVVGITIIALNAYQFFYLSELDVPKTPFALVMQQFQESSLQCDVLLRCQRAYRYQSDDGHPQQCLR